MRQTCLHKSSQGAVRAEKNDFENRSFVVSLAVLWKHRPSEESPKMTKKPPKTHAKAQQAPPWLLLVPFGSSWLLLASPGSSCSLGILLGSSWMLHPIPKAIRHTRRP
jgi:hypothetical protein